MLKVMQLSKHTVYLDTGKHCNIFVVICQERLWKITSNREMLSSLCKLTTWGLGKCLYFSARCIKKLSQVWAHTHAHWLTHACSSIHTDTQNCVYTHCLRPVAIFNEGNAVSLSVGHCKLDHYVIWWLGLCGQAVWEAEAYIHLSREQTPSFALSCQLKPKSLPPLPFQAWPKQCLQTVCRSLYTTLRVWRCVIFSQQGFPW